MDFSVNKQNNDESRQVIKISGDPNSVNIYLSAKTQSVLIKYERRMSGGLIKIIEPGNTINAAPEVRKNHEDENVCEVGDAILHNVQDGIDNEDGEDGEDSDIDIEIDQDYETYRDIVIPKKKCRKINNGTQEFVVWNVLKQNINTPLKPAMIHALLENQGNIYLRGDKKKSDLIDGVFYVKDLSQAAQRIKECCSKLVKNDNSGVEWIQGGSGYVYRI